MQFLVATEFSVLVGVRCSRIETLAAAGNSGPTIVKALNNLNAYLSASQLGITLASLGLGWVGELVIARLLERPFRRDSRMDGGTGFLFYRILDHNDAAYGPG